MGGICGVVTRRRGAVEAGGPQANTALLHRMASVMIHRGPDDAGFLLAGGPEGSRRLVVAGAEELPADGRRMHQIPQPLEVALGMRRLAIIDPAGGHQPIGNEDGTIWLVFGGEIYNHRELRAQLERRGHHFATASDGETIIHAYEEYGRECVRHLQGKFAFALWDDPRHFLLLARDRAGAKPLFVAEVAGRFLFASEIKALLQDPALRRAVDPEALYHYATYGYVPAPRTLFQGIFQLPPGHFLAWSDGEPVVEEYWEGPETRLECPGLPSRRGAARAHRPKEAWESLQAAVRSRLTTDLPGSTRGCGVFLDGGLTSAAIAAAARETLGAAVPSVAVGLGAGDRGMERSRRIAQHLQTDHHEVRLEPDAAALWPRVIRHLDEPLADAAALPQFLLTQAARPHMTVALGSWGASLWVQGGRCAVRGDHSDIPLAKRLSNSLLGLRNAASLPSLRSGGYPAPCVAFESLFDGPLKRALFAGEAEDCFPSSLGMAEPHLSRLADGDQYCQAAYLELKMTLPGSALLMADRLGMAFGLETRAPFLAPALLELLFADPAGLPGPSFLRRALAGHLPAPLRALPVDRDLDGDRWLTSALASPHEKPGPLWEVVRAALAPDMIRERGYFSPEAVQATLHHAQDGRGPHARRAWALFALEVWHRIYLDNDYSARDNLTFADLGLSLPSAMGSCTTEAQRAQRETEQQSREGASTPSSLHRICGEENSAEERPLSILMAAESDPTQVTGGPSRLLREWSTRLAARGHTVTVMAPRADSQQAIRETWSGVEVIRFAAAAGHPVGRVNTVLREGARTARCLVNKHSFDVITVHDPLIGCALLRAAPRRARSSCAGPARLYTFFSPWAEVSRAVRGATLEMPETGLMRACSALSAHTTYFAKRELERTAIDACDEVAVFSHFSAEQLLACHSVPEARVRRISPGVDTDRFRPRADRRELRRRLGLSESAFLLLTIRPMSPMAGLEQLITALAGITAVFPEAHLVIGGCPHPEAARHVSQPSWEADLRRQVAAQSLEGAVTFAGSIPELLLPEYYAMADLFVMPSQCLEPVGLAALESLASGTPVFGTPVGALPELLADLDPAALFAGTGAVQIADRIIRRLPDLHHDGALRRRCRQYAVEHFSWDVVLPAAEALLRDAVARRRADGRRQTPDDSKVRSQKTGARRWAPGAG